MIHEYLNTWLESLPYNLRPLTDQDIKDQDIWMEPTKTYPVALARMEMPILRDTLEIIARNQNSDDGNDYLSASGISQMNVEELITLLMVREGMNFKEILDHILNILFRGYGESETRRVIRTGFPAHYATGAAPDLFDPHIWRTYQDRVRQNDREDNLPDIDEPFFRDYMEAETYSEAIVLFNRARDAADEASRHPDHPGIPDYEILYDLWQEAKADRIKKTEEGVHESYIEHHECLEDHFHLSHYNNWAYHHPVEAVYPYDLPPQVEEELARNAPND